MKCTICDYTADTLMVLQPHILSHLSQTGIRCSQCHFTFQTPRDLSRHLELHRHTGLESKSTQDQAQLSESVGVASPKDDTCIVESPIQKNTEKESSEQEQRAGTAEVRSGNKAEESFTYNSVKSEPSSPRLASSPIQNHVTLSFPVPPLLPHVPFLHDVPTVPQASEILAKMSELVHRRLRHGGTSFPPMMYGALVPKGATCFECNITFSNLDNYLVHKKHYCNGRWQHMSRSSDYGILDKASQSPKTGGGLAIMLNASHPFEVKGHNPAQFNTSLAETISTGGKAPEEFLAKGKKASTPCDAEGSSSSVVLDSKNPKTSETELAHNQTTCEACKITFGRYENYMVHKQYYCATRHDPPAKRAANNKHVQKSFRTRKRRKMPSPDPIVSQSYSISSSYMSQDTVESLKDVLNHRYNMIQGLVQKHSEPSLTVTKSALVSKCNAIAREEGDAPIDLSKKCTMQFKVSGLLDYHECAMCKISFNKVEEYLIHKQNLCPGAENKSPSITEDHSRKANPSDIFRTEYSLQGVGTSASAEKQASIKGTHNMMNSNNYPGAAKKLRPDDQIWPYYEIKPADYATGIFVPQNERRQSPNEGTEGEKEQPMPDGSHVGSENTALSLSLQGDDKHGNKSRSSSAPSFTACTPDLDGSVNPKESISSSSASKTEEICSVKRGMNGSFSPALNGKYCRPCDIQFNNLSNFITHKKFYCSTHTPEHVK